MHPKNPEGNGWIVREFTHYTLNTRVLGVFSRALNDGHLSSIRACGLCVAQAMAGDPDAIAAIILCPEDNELDREIKKHGTRES